MYTSLSRFIWHFAKPYRWHVAGLFFIGLLWAAYFSLNPAMIKLIIDAVSDHPTDLIEHVLGPALGFLSMALVLVGLSTAYDYLILKFAPHFKAGIIEQTNAYLQQHSYSFFQTNLAGSLSNKISDLSKGSLAIVTSIIDDFFSRTLLFVFGLTTLFWVHPLFAFAMIGWSAIFFTLSYFLAKKSEKYSVDYSEARSTVMGKVVDAISNIFNIKLFGTRQYEHGYLRKHLREMIGKEQHLHWYMLKLKLVQSISISFLLVAMVGILIYTRLQNLITVGDFALVLTLSTAIVDETFYLALQFVAFTEELGVCKQALSILSKQPEAVDAPHAAALKVTHGEIVFENVSFHYVAGKPIYQNLNLTISPREKVGLVGLSGSGKSTLAHLLLRLYDLAEGRILIDGQDIAQVTRESLVQNIAFIPQDSSLFHRSVMENIRYGKLDASETEVILAAKKARSHDFIDQMKDGYQTIVGERGMRLSGGQRQRIAIARAILKNAPILVLDEATSALDSYTEQQIQESLSTLMQNSTTLVIAHRLSTLHHMDRILVFDQGKVVEEGTHETLLEKEGRYAQLWRMQSGQAPSKLPYLV